jgi:hypothetical protein
MSEGNYGHPGNEGPEHSRAHLGHRLYWKRAHRDWRVWVGLFFCLAAIIIYVLSEDLSFMPGGRPRPPVSNSAGR